MSDASAVLAAIERLQQTPESQKNWFAHWRTHRAALSALEALVKERAWDGMRNSEGWEERTKLRNQSDARLADFVAVVGK